MEIVRYDARYHDLNAITALLHRAYAPLLARGLNFVASTQDDAITQRRLTRGAAWIAVEGAKIIGVISCYERATAGDPPEWYTRDGVFVFAQFAVDPNLQRAGIGTELIRTVEHHARTSGASELACDTAEPAQHLLDYYSKRGFRTIGSHRWPHATYNSIIFSKTL